MLQIISWANVMEYYPSTIDINECQSDLYPCHKNAACNNIDGNYTCSCNVGYHGNGSSCTGM